MNVLGVILARAGSKGLANKHLLDLAGRAVIDYTFDHAQSAASLTRVVLTTDCPRLRAIAKARWIETLDRPADLAGDEASVQATLLHATDEVERRSNRSFRVEVVVTLYGNVAVRSPDAVDRCVRTLLNTGCDSVRTFTPVGKWHPAWMATLDETDAVTQHLPGSTHRRQDLAPLWLHDGGVVAVTRTSLERGRARPDDPHAFFGTDRRGVRCGIGENVEIDSPFDLAFADTMLRRQHTTTRRVRMAV